MLRKLIFLAITSGLAKKGYEMYKARHAGTTEPRHVANRRDRTGLSAVPTHHRSPTASDAG